MTPIELTGKAGDLIIVDVGNIHRGKVIEEGVRYSLTNYYQKDAQTSERYCKTIKKFTLLLVFFGYYIYFKELFILTTVEKSPKIGCQF